MRLFRLKVQDQPAVLALSSRPWLAYSHQAQMRVTPLSYDPLDFAAMFSSELVGWKRGGSIEEERQRGRERERQENDKEYENAGKEVREAIIISLLTL